MDRLQVEITANASPFVRGANSAISQLSKLDNAFNQSSSQSRQYWNRLASQANTGTAGVSRSLDRLGDKLSTVGGRLTAGLTLPLGLLSGAAFKTYGDIDALRLGLVNIEGSTATAAARFKELREVAKLPGLGLAEAVQGDVRLRALGFSALESKNALLQFGNALALTGGGKTELDNVLTQLTQMASKSSVLTEDLKPIINAGPAIAAAVKNLFGTVNAEEISAKLKAAGKAPKDFVNDLVTALSKLERVAGGPKNALENFGDNVKIASYEFMRAADSSLGLTTKLERLGNVIGEVATGFAALPAPIQSTIFVVGGLATAFGPLTLGIGAVMQLIPTFQKGLEGIRTAFTTLLSPVGLATIGLTALAALLGTMVYGVYQYNRALTASVDKSRQMAAINAQVTQSIGAEVARLNSLVAIAKDENRLKSEREKAIKQINEISPKYLNNLTLETIGTDAATKSINAYVKALTLRSKATALATELAQTERQITTERAKGLGEYGGGIADSFGAFFDNPFNTNTSQLVEEKLAERQATAVNTLLNTRDNLVNELKTTTSELAKIGELDTGGTSLTNYGGLGGEKGKTISELIEAQLKAVERQIKDFEVTHPGVRIPLRLRLEKGRLQDLLKIDDKTDLPTVSDIGPVKSVAQRYWEAVSKGWLTPMERAFLKKKNDVAGTIEALTESAGRAAEKAAQQKQLKGEYSNVNAGMDYWRTLGDFRLGINQAVESGSIGQGVVDALGFDMIDRAAEQGKFSLAKLADLSRAFQDTLYAFSDGIKQVSVNITANVFEAMGQAIGGSANVLQTLLRSIGNMLAQYLRTVGEMLIKVGIFQLAGPTAPLGIKSIAVGGAMIAGAGVLTALSNKAIVPAMANSGLAYGPQLTMIGDNPNARFDPEMVAPVSDIKEVIRAAAGGGGTMPDRIELFARGSELVGVIDRANKKINNRG